VHKIKIGISPIAWLNDDMPNLSKGITVEKCLSEIAKCGYAGVENCGSFPTEKNKIEKLLKRFNLKFSGGWYSANLIKNSVNSEFKKMKNILEIFKKMKTKNLVFCETTDSIQGKKKNLSKRPSIFDRENKRYFLKLNKLAKITKKKFNVNICYHHHMGTLIQNEKEIDLLMKNTCKDVKLLLDTGHLIFAGIDPIKIYKKYYSRISHVHLKDVRENILNICVKNDLSFLSSFLKGVFTVPGDGSYNFSSLLNNLKKDDYNGWVIVEAEQDPKKYSPYIYSLKGYKNIKKILKI
jgi:inosose dehydratase